MEFMIEGTRSDRVFAFLLGNSSLTDVQLDTIMSSRIEGTLSVKISSREKGKISKGAFVRTLRQGERNIEKSICTLMLLGYLGVVPVEKFDQFQRTLRLLSRVKEIEPGEEDVSRLVAGIENFMCDFSQRPKRKAIL